MRKRTFVTLFGTYELIKLVSSRKVNKVKSQKPTFLLRGQWYEINIQKGNSNFVFRRTSTEIAMLFFGRRSAYKNPHPYPVQRILPHSYLLHNMQIWSLSTRVFETRTATGSELFSILTCPNTTIFTFLSIFSSLEMSGIKILETMRS